MNFQAIDPNSLLLFIILAPLFGSILNATLGRDSKATVRGIAIGSIAIAFGCALVAFLKLTSGGHGEEHEPARLSFVAYDWFNVYLGDHKVPLRVAFVMDQLSGIMTLMVTGIGLLIHIFASSYMHDDPSYHRFFAYLNLFMASMLILVLGSSLPMMFVGWEGVGLCSYLLIGFWWENPTYAAAGKKAFIVNRIGDFGVLVGMFLLASAAGSFEFSDIRALGSDVLQSNVNLGGAFGRELPVTLATLSALFLFLGCSGKSAQIPLYVWLPDAMAGPTPVSALIHAATMVTSGVYLCVRLSPIFAASPTAMATIAVVGSLTAFFAASIGLVQNHMKKILAYSTVSQLGFMFAAVGVGAFAGGIFHVFTHAFFKACLFLGAGSVMHAVHAHGDADIRELGGMKKFMPWTHATFLVSCLAIAGVPGFSGFFSKDDILLGAVRAGHGQFEGFPPALGWFVFGLLALTAAMTAFYMFRLYILTFTGEFRGGPKHEHHDDHAHAAPAAPTHDAHPKFVDDNAPTEVMERNAQAEAHDAHGSHDAHAAHSHDPHESDAWMTIPLAILSVGALFAGFLGMPHWLGLPNIWEHFLEPLVANVYGESHVDIAIGATAMGVGTTVGIVGIALAYVFYVQGAGATPKAIAEKFPKLHALLMDKWRVDEFYAATIIRAAEWLAKFSAAFDKLFIDGIVAKLTPGLTSVVAWIFTRAQNGQVAAYGAAMAVGLAGMVWWFSVPHVTVAVQGEGDAIKVVADKGLGYEYRFDTNDDGEFETEWAQNSEAPASFHDADVRHGLVLLHPSRPGAQPIEISVGEHPVVLSTSDLAGAGQDWRSGDDATPPSMTWRDGKIVLRRNGARVQGADATGEEIELAPGDRINLGSARFTVAAVVSSTVEVRSAFGYVSHYTIESTLQRMPGAAAPAEHAVLLGGAR